MKALKKVLVALTGAIVGCCFFAGCLSAKLSVTYMVDGETYRVQEYEMDTQISLPKAPTKEGYTFIGWYTDEALTEPYAEGSVTAGLTLYAKFSVSSVYIVVNTAGGEKINAIEVTPGADYTIPAAQKEGHTFLGYTYIDENGDEQEFPLTGKYPNSVGIRITAKYEVNKYNVTFVGDSESTQEVAYGSVAVAPNVDKPGYNFDGWYTSATEQTEATKFDLATAIKGEVTLYAKYTAKTYTIAVSLNGGVLANEADKNVTVTYDSAYALATPTRTGYTFLGYELDGASFAISGTYNCASNVIVSAKWQQDKYVVVFKDFDTDEEISTVENLVYGDRLPSIPAAATGYEYVNTYAEDKLTTVDVANVTMSGNLVVYVKYQLKTFTITVNFAQKDYENPSVKYGETYTLAIPDRGANYEFVMFTKDGVEFPVTGTYTWTENITIDAVWDGAGKDVIFFDGTNELTALRIETEYGANVTEIAIPDVPQKAGYTADNKWYADAAFTTEFVAEGTVETDIRLYAKYTANSYKITIVDDGKTEDVDVVYNAEYSLPTLSKDGYIFKGYKLISGGVFETTGVYTTVGDTFVQPVWQEDKVIVNFIIDATVTEVEVLRNWTVAAIKEPSKTGYSFTGWYTSATPSEETKFDFATKLTADETNLYAGFKANDYTLTFVVWDKATKTTKNVDVTVTYGATINNIPEKAERDAYDFKGYIYNGEFFDTTKVYAYAMNITVEEKWELREDASLFDYNPDGNYFTERDNYNADWTYVYLVGETYTYGDLVELSLVKPSDDVYAEVAGNALTIKTAGEFELQVNTNGNIEVRKIKAVEYIKALGVGGTAYDEAWGLNEAGTDYKRNASDVWDKKVSIGAGEVMKVGKNNFIPEISINGKVATFDTASINVSVKVGGVESNDYNVANGAINFGASLVGQQVEVTLAPKYNVGNYKAVYNVEVNNAVNVYTNEDLKASFANKLVTEINVLRKIEVALSDDQVIKLTINGWEMVSPKNYSKTDSATGAYERRSGSLKINGNYFTVDGSKLPLVDARSGETSVYTDPDGSSYRTVDTRFGIFLFGTRQTLSSDVYTIDNLNIIGNGKMDAAAYYEMSGTDRKVLQYSGAAIGIEVGAGELNMNNVTSRFGSFGLLASTPKTFEKDGVPTLAVTINATDCKLEKSWANNVYAHGSIRVNLDSCFIGAANGAAIHLESRPSKIAIDGELNLLNDTDIQNWVSGQEAWFTAQNATSVVPELRATVENYVQQFSGGKATAGTYSGGARTIINADGKINFAILMRRKGDASEWANGKDALGANWLQHTDAYYQGYTSGATVYGGQGAMALNLPTLDLGYVTFMQTMAKSGKYYTANQINTYCYTSVMTNKYVMVPTTAMGYMEVYVGLNDNK